MFRERLPVSTLLVLAGAMLMACVDVSEELSAPRPQATIRQNQALSDEDRELREFTRRLAIALGSDPALRTRMFSSLRSSPHGEGKRHVRTLLTQSEPTMLTGIARAGNRTADSVVASLDEIRDMEIYLPVEEHRSRWKGESNLVVASALEDRKGQIHAFNLDGQPIALSWDGPPNTPVLAVVPNETDFTDPTAGTAGSASAMTLLTNADVWMTESTIYEDWEGWLMGDSEFEIHVTKPDGSGGFEYLEACAGAQAPSPMRYNQDDVDWSGEVMVASGFSPGERFFEVWEDDQDACNADGHHLKPESGDVGDWINTTKSVVEAFDDGLDLVKLAEAAPDVLSLLRGGDDFVGSMRIPGDCWPRQENGPTKFIIKKDGTPNGRVKLDFRFADQNAEPICDPDPLLAGPSFLTAGQSGTWNASVITGVPPYSSVKWYRDGQHVTTGSSYSFQAGTQSFTLRVETKDSRNRPGSETMSVFVSNCPPPQIECD